MFHFCYISAIFHQDPDPFFYVSRIRRILTRIRNTGYNVMVETWNKLSYCTRMSDLIFISMVVENFKIDNFCLRLYVNVFKLSLCI